MPHQRRHRENDVRLQLSDRRVRSSTSRFGMPSAVSKQVFGMALKIRCRGRHSRQAFGTRRQSDFTGKPCNQTAPAFGS